MAFDPNERPAAPPTNPAPAPSAQSAAAVDGETLERRLQRLEDTVPKMAGDTGAAIAALSDRELQCLVSAALEAHREVRSRDRALAERVRAGHEPHGVEAARPIAALYRQWYGASRRLLSLIQAPDHATKDVAGREELLQACRQASFPATVDLDRVMRGLEQARRGEGIPLDEAMDELRRRRHA